MEVEQRFRNGEAQTQSAKLPGDGWFALLESLENPALLLGLNADPGVGDFEHEPFSFVGRPNRDATFWVSKFHRIVDQVPQNLLNSDWVGPHMMTGSIKFHYDFDLFFKQVLLRDLDGIAQKTMLVERFTAQLDLAARNSRQVQEIID